MGKYKKMTIWFIFITIAVIAIYDIFVIGKGGTEVSISHVLLEWSYKYPALTFMLGGLCGHLFWRIRDTEGTREMSAKSRGE